MSQVSLDELVSICELLLFFSRILNPFATKLSLFVFLVISWRCQSLRFGGRTSFLFLLYASLEIHFFNHLLIDFCCGFISSFWPSDSDSEREAGRVGGAHTCRHTHAYIEPSIHSSKCCKYLFYNVVCTRVKFATIFYAPNWRRWIEFGNGSRTVFRRVCLFIFGSVLAWI